MADQVQGANNVKMVIGAESMHTVLILKPGQSPRADIWSATTQGDQHCIQFVEEEWKSWNFSK